MANEEDLSTFDRSFFLLIRPFNANQVRAGAVSDQANPLQG